MRTPVRLTDVKCRTASTGSHCDGHGLYLLVKPAGTRSWLFRYALVGRQHWMGLGSFPVVTLKRAREKALEARRLLADGEDPLAHKRAARASLRQQHTKQLRALTFDQCAEQFIKSHSAGWRSVMHAKQWSQSLRDHVSPVIGDMPVAAIDTESALKVLEPIWTKMPTAAGRVRNRIELILDWARVKHYREGENPARWRGHLDHLLVRRSRLRVVRHFPSVPHSELPSFLARLRQSESVASRALEFTILRGVTAQAPAGRSSSCDGRVTEMALKPHADSGAFRA
ncbi:MAG: Arm DNA-binding domain-containing protein [Xanthobacteraceae bacterium]